MARPRFSLLLVLALAVACGSRRHSVGSASVPDEDGAKEAVREPVPTPLALPEVRFGDAPGVLLVGRSEKGASGQRFSWPATHMEARFYGTSVSVELDDEDHENQFEVIVDGKRVEKLTTVKGQRRYELANDLALGVHDVTLWRRTESVYGPTEFVSFDGFGEQGRLLPPRLLSQRRIEVIGDSTTLGFGNEGIPECKGGKENQNSYETYGPVAARLVGADVVMVAWSGVGMYRNFDEDGPSPDSMAQLYDYSLLDPRVPWDFSRYEPDAVIIGLGSNDYSTRGDPGAPFVDAYVDFVRHVRDQYPNATILCLVQREAFSSNVEQVVRTLSSEGDERVHSFDIRVDHGAPGCDGHPSVERHRVLGEKLAAELRRVMAWN